MDKRLERLREAWELLEGSEADFVEVDGNRRPIRNSLGKLIHSTKEGAINFWKWFGDSKVVDSEGRPLMVYHGIKVDFKDFDSSFIGSRYGQDRKVFFFTGDPSEVLGGAVDYGKDGVVKKCYLRIETPITLSDYARSLGASISEIMYYGGDEQPVISLWDEDKEAIMALDSSADGIILSHSSLHPLNSMFVVFDSSQIRVVD